MHVHIKRFFEQVVEYKMKNTKETLQLKLQGHLVKPIHRKIHKSSKDHLICDKNIFFNNPS